MRRRDVWIDRAIGIAQWTLLIVLALVVLVAAPIILVVFAWSQLR